jgi:hypothetical protein
MANLLYQGEPVTVRQEEVGQHHTGGTLGQVCRGICHTRHRLHLHLLPCKEALQQGIHIPAGLDNK